MHRLIVRLSLFMAFAWTSALAQADATMWNGAYAQVRANYVDVARDQAAWETLWRTWVGADPPRSLPVGSMGVAVFIGPRRTGGYDVEVLGIEQRDCLDVVKFVEHVPSQGAFITQAFTMPWTIALLPVSGRPIVFERQGAMADTRLLLPASDGGRLMQMSEICSRDRRP
ncbi:MAG: protease complex subunit PrcB family protein [Reyranella sp.]|uniref:protease complex subunit PrcB family protein n=1 Tax=Reyranella sp. TaxID=1929291 RepID=UPI0011F929AF|nr:protease complex subunit PrcB family protein [Reyranella sp.]TAJ42066.1 MAG: protease complex subunit PrcB family protein [Reyranella sp.]